MQYTTTSSMKKRFNIVFNNYEFADGDIPSSQKKLLDTFNKTVYTDERGFGFKKIEDEANIIYATLIKRTMTSVLEYISEDNEFRNIDIPIFEEVKFSFDTNMSLLYTFGAANNLNKLKMAIRNTFASTITYKALYLSPVEIMNKLLNNNKDSIKVTELIISNFKHKDGIIGKYIAKVNKQNIISDILKDYAKEIQKISISILGDLDYELIIASNQSLTIKCAEDDFYTILEFLKFKIYG